MTLTNFLIITGISILLIIVGRIIAFINQEKIEDSDSALVITLIGYGLLLSGSFFLPAVKAHDDYLLLKEVERPEVIHGEYSIIVSTQEFSIMDNSYFPKAFNSQRIKSEINDSTRFYLSVSRSLFKVPMERKVVWSNPPHEIFYDE